MVPMIIVFEYHLLMLMARMDCSHAMGRIANPTCVSVESQSAGDHVFVEAYQAQNVARFS